MKKQLYLILCITTVFMHADFFDYFKRKKQRDQEVARPVQTQPAPQSKEEMWQVVYPPKQEKTSRPSQEPVQPEVIATAKQEPSDVPEKEVQQKKIIKKPAKLPQKAHAKAETVAPKPSDVEELSEESIATTQPKLKQKKLRKTPARLPEKAVAEERFVGLKPAAKRKKVSFADPDKLEQVRTYQPEEAPEEYELPSRKDQGDLSLS